MQAVPKLMMERISSQFYMPEPNRATWHAQFEIKGRPAVLALDPIAMSDKVDMWTWALYQQQGAPLQFFNWQIIAQGGNGTNICTLNEAVKQASYALLAFTDKLYWIEMPDVLALAQEEEDTRESERIAKEAADQIKARLDAVGSMGGHDGTDD